LIKFIVNGEFRCDDHLLPTITDESGNVNNILEIGYDNDTERMSLQSSIRRGMAAS
jgi:Glycogen recognition site of AMP-activated protein kinase